MDDTDAGSTSLSSADNVFIGHDAGGGTWADAQSKENVAIGNYAMDGALDGAIRNVAIGHGTLSTANRSRLQSILGIELCSFNTGGQNVIMIGHEAGLNGQVVKILLLVIMQDIITKLDIYNVHIGVQAGYGASGNSEFEYCSWLEILWDSIGTGGNNVAMGTSAMHSGVGAANQVAIGSNLIRKRYTLLLVD